MTETNFYPIIKNLYTIKVCFIMLTNLPNLLFKTSLNLYPSTRMKAKEFRTD